MKKHSRAIQKVVYKRDYCLEWDPKSRKFKEEALRMQSGSKTESEEEEEEEEV